MKCKLCGKTIPIKMTNCAGISKYRKDGIKVCSIMITHRQCAIKFLKGMIKFYNATIRKPEDDDWNKVFVITFSEKYKGKKIYIYNFSSKDDWSIVQATVIK